MWEGTFDQEEAGLRNSAEEYAIQHAMAMSNWLLGRIEDLETQVEWPDPPLEYQANSSLAGGGSSRGGSSEGVEGGGLGPSRQDGREDGGPGEGGRLDALPS